MEGRVVGYKKSRGLQGLNRIRARGAADKLEIGPKSIPSS